MAKKLYEEENVREIANTIRDLTGDSETKYKLVNMPQGMSNVFAAGHKEGYDIGLDEGADKLKRDEARTVDAITYSVSTSDVTITVPSGYYANTENKVLDELDTLKNAEYDAGLEDGYNRGFADGDREGYNNGYLDGYDDGYEVGFEAGSAGGVADPTTVWEIIEKPDLTDLPTSADPINVNFNSAGIDFVGIYKTTGLGGRLIYKKESGTTNVLQGNVWVNFAYRTITIVESITDDRLLSWLQNNAILISGTIDTEPSESEIEEMLVSTDENYDDEGKEFYSVYKWIDVYNTSLSSAPVTITVMNNHPTFWIHAYIRVFDTAGNAYHFTLPIEYDQGENSIEVDFPVSHFEVEGIRWSRRGI